jgi:hypothetical protein
MPVHATFTLTFASGRTVTAQLTAPFHSTVADVEWSGLDDASQFPPRLVAHASHWRKASVSNLRAIFLNLERELGPKFSEKYEGQYAAENE